MQFTNIVLVALTVFSSSAFADPHRNLSCNYLGRYDWQLTKATCEENFKSMANYDQASGWCVTNSHQRIDGDRWENDCASIACRGWSQYYDKDTGDSKYRYQDCNRKSIKGIAHD
ncbi:hypothetical protein DIS24_g11915 [Lasiodiplodia hormozganensis]|uniref:Cyanovirin-N domain-containing protein n=1 Tax=Lasiodiplodia hormozganensis TaxID=869390 RepID=A0AA39WG53_9PEZI|nr:hypothetical protein DIS24_g11915 [Lasiodiplodia hormozganensis]